MVYIYGLIDPRDNKIKYVGKTVDLHERLMQHLRDFRGCTKKINWIKHLIARELKPEIISLEECTEETWEGREKWWIAALEQMGAVLKNGTAGGDGCSYWTGKKRRPSTMEKIAQQARGEKSTLSRLTEENIFEIVDMYKGGASYKEIQKKYKISEAHLGNILAGRRWKHLGIKITEEDKRNRQLLKARKGRRHI